MKRLKFAFALIALIFLQLHIALPVSIFAAADCAEPYAAEALPSSPVFARSDYRDAYMYAKRESSPMFAVPPTYCVEVLGEEGDWYYARYASDTGVYRELRGYCRKDKFTLLDFVPQITYLYKQVTVTFTAGASAAVPVDNKLSLDAAYYGVYEICGEYYSYVCCQGSFIYIEGANDDYEPNRTSATPTDDPPAEGGGDGGGEQLSKPSVSAGLIAALIILALFAGVIAMLHFTGRRSVK